MDGSVRLRARQQRDLTALDAGGQQRLVRIGARGLQRDVVQPGAKALADLLLAHQPMTDSPARIAYLWLVLVVGMSLHASYDLSAIRYGVDVTIQGAQGAVPWSNFWLKSIFYVVPMLFGSACVVFDGKAFRWLDFAGATLFLLSNLSHVASQGFHLSPPLEAAQTVLLVAMVLVNVPLVTFSYRHARGACQEPTIGAAR